MQPCPRQDQSYTPPFMKDFKSEWRDGSKGRSCSYCGSMHPDDVFAAIEAGGEIGPTDKSYKIYVDIPNPRAGQPSVRASANYDCSDREGWVGVTAENLATLPLDDYQRKNFEPGKTWVQVGREGDREQGKFYFQHFTVDEQQRFIDLLNAKKINIGVPGYFYSRPFFIAPPEKAKPSAA